MFDTCFTPKCVVTAMSTALQGTIVFLLVNLVIFKHNNVKQNEGKCLAPTVLLAV